jgi:hypothetical protein
MSRQAKIIQNMKVITGRFGRAKMYVGPQPTHGVYYQYDLAMAGEQAKEVSLHWTFKSAVDAAAHEELKGLWPVVVCFEQPANQSDHKPARNSTHAARQ